MDILVFVKIWIIVLSFAESFDDNLLEEEFARVFPIVGFALVFDHSLCLYVCTLFFLCSFMFRCIDDDVIVLYTQLHSCIC